MLVSYLEDLLDSLPKFNSRLIADNIPCEVEHLDQNDAIKIIIKKVTIYHSYCHNHSNPTVLNFHIA